MRQLSLGTVFFVALLALSAGSIRAQNRSLGKVLHEVEATAPTLKAARANADASHERKNLARSRLLGEIDAMAQTVHFNDNRLTRPIAPPISLPSLTFDNNHIGYGAGIQLPLDFNGRLRNSLAAASHQEKAAKSSVEDVRLTLLNRAATLYRSLEQIAGLRIALQKQYEALEGHIRVASKAVEIGRIADVERLRLVAELRIVEGRLAGLDGAEAGIRARLASLIEARSFALPVPPPEQEPDSLGARDEALSERPDLRAANELVAASRAQVKANKASYFPDFFASASWFQNQGFDGSGTGDATWQVGIQARLPLWTGRRRKAQVAQAKAQFRARQYQEDALTEAAKAELAASSSAWSAAKAQYRAAQSAVTAAEEVTRIQTDRFDQGRLSATDLVDAEASLAGVRSELAASLARWWQADDALQLAVGLAPAAYYQFDNPPKQ